MSRGAINQALWIAYQLIDDDYTVFLFPFPDLAYKALTTQGVPIEPCFLLEVLFYHDLEENEIPRRRRRR
jgi:hypothetical protein